MKSSKKFTLRALVVAVALLAVVFAWRSDRMRLRREIEAAQKEIEIAKLAAEELETELKRVTFELRATQRASLRYQEQLSKLRPKSSYDIYP